MVHNPFKRFGSICKLNVDSHDMDCKEMPDGLFPTEPIFVAAPGATEEDEGAIVFSGINGRKELIVLSLYLKNERERERE